jgi:hypothetical protein
MRAMPDRPCIRLDGKAASRLAPKGDDGAFNFYVAMNGRNAWDRAAVSSEGI